jgi:hypothetical protein
MAWTTKSDRFGSGSIGVSMGASHIGPGHYKSVTSLNIINEHAYAPFGSTDPRDSTNNGHSGKGEHGAPVGAYDPKLPGQYDAGLPRRSVPLGGSAIRIDIRNNASTDFRPGPGTYKVDKELDPSQKSRTMGNMPTGKNMLRSSSAPSIPQNHQSYGYEEVGGGRLVRQGPKDPTLFSSGTPHDSAGPGQYDVDSVRPRQTHGAFLRGPARVPLAAQNLVDGPGPGHYQAKSSLEIHSNSYNVGASFASDTSRGPSKREEKRKMESPGPGTYSQQQKKTPDLRELRPELQYFGSTVDRFSQGADKSGAADHVGPGCYTQLNWKPAPPNAKGFCISEERFKRDALKPGVAPGPGEYHVGGMENDMSSGKLATFSMLGNSGGLAFGTMSKRLHYGTDDGKPGPGYYGAPNGMTDDVTEAPEEVDSRGKMKRRPFKASRLPGSAFASKTPKDDFTRSLIKEGQQKPPPGAYNPVLVKDQATVVRLRSKSEGFLSGGNRFSGGPLDAPKGYHANVGPGKYSLQDVTGGKRFGTFNRSMIEGMPEGGRPKGLGFESQDKRFKNSAADKLPGPGQYKTDPKWITKSHNCYFGDLL